MDGREDGIPAGLLASGVTEDRRWRRRRVAAPPPPGAADDGGAAVRRVEGTGDLDATAVAADANAGPAVPALHARGSSASKVSPIRFSVGQRVQYFSATLAGGLGGWVEAVVEGVRLDAQGAAVVAYDLSRKRNAPAQRVRPLAGTGTATAAAGRPYAAALAGGEDALFAAADGGAAAAAAEGDVEDGVNGHVVDDGSDGFAVGEQVLYWSETRSRWVQSAVEAKHMLEGTPVYDLSCKRAVPAGRLRPQFKAGEQVEYLSAGSGRWILARVVRVNDRRGVCDLNIKQHAPWDKLRRAPAAAIARPAAVPRGGVVAVAPKATAALAKLQRERGSKKKLEGRTLFEEVERTVFEEVEALSRGGLVEGEPYRLLGEEMPKHAAAGHRAADNDASAGEEPTPTSAISETAATVGWQAMLKTRNGEAQASTRGRAASGTVAASVTARQSLAPAANATAAAPAYSNVFMARPKKKIAPPPLIAAAAAELSAQGRRRRRAASGEPKRKKKRKRLEASGAVSAQDDVGAARHDPYAVVAEAPAKRGRWPGSGAAGLRALSRSRSPRPATLRPAPAEDRPRRPRSPSYHSPITPPGNGLGLARHDPRLRDRRRH